jgi:putative NADPH-quinone reductase
MTTLVLNFHPDPPQSKANCALSRAAAGLPNTEIVMMADQMRDGAFDYATEVARLHSAGRIVWQFPVHWYAAPGLLAEWQAQILTRLFYATPDEAAKLAGLPLLVAATAGNVPENYEPGGQVAIPLPELLRPLEATARRCGFAWADPFLMYRANRLEIAEREQEAHRFADHLQHWAARYSRPLNA